MHKTPENQSHASHQSFQSQRWFNHLWNWFVLSRESSVYNDAETWNSSRFSHLRSGKHQVCVVLARKSYSYHFIDFQDSCWFIFCSSHCLLWFSLVVSWASYNSPTVSADTKLEISIPFFCKILFWVATDWLSLSIKTHWLLSSVEKGWPLFPVIPVQHLQMYKSCQTKSCSIYRQRLHRENRT